MHILTVLIIAAVLALQASPAHAAPVVAAVAAYIGATAVATFASSVIGGFLINAAAAIGASYLAQSLSKQKADIGAAKTGSIGTELELDAGEEVPRKFLVGTAPTEGTLVYANSHSSYAEIGNAFLVQVIAISDWPITGLLPDLFVNGRKCTWSSETTHEQPALSSGWGYPIPQFKWADPDLSGGSTRDYLWVKFLAGSQTAADSYLQDKFGSSAYPINANFVGKNVAYLIVTQRFGHKSLKGSPARVRVAAKGIALYDPRKDSTAGGSGAHRWDSQATWEWSENPMLIAYNILRGLYLDGEWFYGLQTMTAQRLPYANWAAAMNECDALVNAKGGGTETQYTCGLEIPVDTPPIDALDALMTACNGRITETGGIYKPKIGAVGSSVFSFTDGNLPADKPEIFEPIRSLADSVTGVHATYRAPAKGWERHVLPPRRDAALEARENGRRLFADIAYDAVYRPSQAQRLAKSELADAGRWRRHQVPLPPEGYLLEPIDTVDWTSVINGYDEKLFDVEGISVTDTLEIVATIRERDPDDYDWDPDADEADVEPIEIEFQDPETYEVQDFGAAAALITGGGGKKEVAIRCQWTTTLTRDVIGIHFRCRPVADTTKVTREFVSEPAGLHHFTNGVIKNTVYEISARYEARSQRETPWTDWAEVSTAPEGLAPGPPTNVRTNPGLSLMELTWTDPTDADLSRVDIYVSETSDSEAARLHGSAIAGMEAYVCTPLETGTQYWFWLQSVDFDGNRSAAAGPYTESTIAFPFGTPNADPPGDATGIVTNAGFRIIGFTWTNPADSDLATIEIWKSDSDDISLAEKVFETAAPGKSGIVADLASDTTYWFWIRTVDYWTNRGRFVAVGPVTTLAGVDEILPDSITQTEIADDSISTPKLQANAVVAATIAAGTILGENIAAATITGANIAAGTITAGNIAAGTITAGNIAAGTITALEIAALTIVAGNIAAATITGSKIAAGTITAANIAVGAINANHLQAGSISAGKIAAGAINVASLFVNGVIITDLIAANAITAPVSDTLGSVQILAAANTWYDLCSVTVNAAGKAVYTSVFGNADIVLVAADAGQVEGQVRLVKGGAVIRLREIHFDATSGLDLEEFTIDVAGLDRNPGAGNVTYKLQARRTSNSANSTNARPECAMWAIAPKK